MDEGEVVLFQEFVREPMPDTMSEMCRSSGEKDLFARGEGEVQR